MRAYQRGVLVNAKEETRGEKGTVFRQVWLLPSDDSDPAQLLCWDDGLWSKVLGDLNTVVVVEVEAEARAYRGAGQLSLTLRGMATEWPSIQPAKPAPPVTAGK